MKQTQKQKLSVFLQDRDTVEAVKEVLLEAFLEPTRSTDVQMKAAERIAIDLLYQGFRRMENYKRVDKESIIKSQVGL